MRKEAEMTINGKALLEERFASSLGLDKYTYLVRQAQKVNIAEDKDFQRVFNAFYRVRKKRRLERPVLRTIRAGKKRKAIL